MDSVYLFNLFWRSVLNFYVRKCHKLLYEQSPVISISLTLNLCSRPTCLNSTIYILVYVILSVSHDADLLHCPYIWSQPGRPYTCIFHIKLLRHLHLRKIQIFACTWKCTLAKFRSFVLVWCFKYSVPLYQL